MRISPVDSAHPFVSPALVFQREAAAILRSCSVEARSHAEFAASGLGDAALDLIHLGVLVDAGDGLYRGSWSAIASLADNLVGVPT